MCWAADEMFSQLISLDQKGRNGFESQEDVLQSCYLGRLWPASYQLQSPIPVQIQQFIQEGGCFLFGSRLLAGVFIIAKPVIQVERSIDVIVDGVAPFAPFNGVRLFFAVGGLKFLYAFLVDFFQGIKQFQGAISLPAPEFLNHELLSALVEQLMIAQFAQIGYLLSIYSFVFADTVTDYLAEARRWTFLLESLHNQLQNIQYFLLELAQQIRGLFDERLQFNTQRGLIVQVLLLLLSQQFIEILPSMLKRDSSNKKLPKIPAADDSISSKLFSLTGLRIFQAKFMEDLRHPKSSLNTMQPLAIHSENPSQVKMQRPTATTQSFTGKDRGNELRPNEAMNVGSSFAKEIKKIELIQKSVKVERIRLKSIRPRGLRNLGNTCYMNAILQSLFSVVDFSAALEKELEGKKSQKNVSLSYSKLVQSIKKSGQKETVSPADFKSILGRKKKRFDNNSQQDAQECLTAFLESVNEQVSRIKEKPKYTELKGDPNKQSIKKIAQDWWNYFKQRDDSIVCDFFQGQSQSMMVCSGCGFRSISFDNFWGLPISLGKKSSNLFELLTASLSTEYQLQDYSCEKCKKQKRCSKISKLFRLPEILIIQLKRFGFGWNRKQKIKDRVEVPLELNLKSIMSEDSAESSWVYRLKSTVEHTGEINFGHYTSHVFCEEQEKWYLCNDEHVTRDEVELDSAKLYLLIYQKK